MEGVVAGERLAVARRNALGDHVSAEPQRPAIRADGPQAKPATNPELRRLIAAYGLFGFGYIITATFLVVIVRGTPAIASLEPVIWIVFGLAAAPSVAVWTAIAARPARTEGVYKVEPA